MNRREERADMCVGKGIRKKFQPLLIEALASPTYQANNFFNPKIDCKMNRLISPSLLIALLLSLLSFSACETFEGPGEILNPGPTFSMDEFEARIIAGLDGKVTGYAYSIGLNGNAAREGAGGFAVIAQTSSEYPNAIPMSHTSRMQIASITKPITALTLYQAMDARNLKSIEVPFALFMPNHWAIHPSLADVSLKDLLEHRSGVKESGNKFADVRALLQAGVDVADKGNYDYNNANYSILRIVIAYMIGAPVLQNPNVIANDAMLGPLSASLYRDYVQSAVLQPAKVNYNPWDQHPTKPTLLYNFSDLNQSPWLTGDYQTGVGAFGLYLSSNSIASVMAHARHQNGYLNQPYYDWFFKENIGLLKTNGEQGPYFYHNGDWKSSGRGFNGTTMVFPNGIEATVLINCRSHDAESEVRILRDAFDAAWE
jgi:hypothetical protein